MPLHVRFLVVRAITFPAGFLGDTISCLVAFAYSRISGFSLQRGVSGTADGWGRGVGAQLTVGVSLLSFDESNPLYAFPEDWSYYLLVLEPASPREKHGDVSWVGSTLRYPVPASLHLLALWQLKPSLSGLSAPELPLFTPSLSVLIQVTQWVGV